MLPTFLKAMFHQTSQTFNKTYFWAMEEYRFSFNGKENDNEVKGFGNQQDYGMRIYDNRLGRFLSVDPLTNEYPWYTPYQFAGNMPIKYIDLDGLEPAEPGKEKGDLLDAPLNNIDNHNHSWEWDGEKWKDGGRSLNEVLVKGSKPIPTLPQIPNHENSSTVPTSNSTPWMNTALKEYKSGVVEDKDKKGRGLNKGPRVDTYLKYAGVSSPNAWCGAYVHWCLGQNDIKGAGAKGSNYLNWGTRLKTPKYGAIAIFTTGHVGFYMGANANGTITILHGNWSSAVSKSNNINPNEIQEYRFPINK